MLVMVKAFLFQILLTLKFTHPNARLLYPIFYMFLLLKKPLLSIQKFYLKNNVFFEFHSSLFYVKDLMTKEVLLSGRSRDGLYVLSESSAMSFPQVVSSICLSTSADVWHHRLRHPSPRILHFLVKNKKVSCTSTQFNFNCFACPLGKSSRLTLKTTGHQTRVPLDLIF
jgi:hypothetical protein